MAHIVLGIGTSHSPLLVLGGEQWPMRAGDDVAGRVPLHTLDGRFHSYQELKGLRGEPYGELATATNFVRQERSAGQALDRLTASLASAAPDVVLIVGDDQGELYEPGNIPAMAVFHGEEFVMRPFESGPIRPPWADREFWKEYARDLPHRFPGAPGLATDLVHGLIERGIDVAVANRVRDARAHGFGHAIGFVIRRLFGGKTYPVIPVLLNTYFPPNTPTPRRCHEIGRHLRAAIEASPRDLRVAVVASGGLSHFVCEEAFDRRVIDALRADDGEALAGLPVEALVSGSSEIRNWILVSGAVSHLSRQWDEYLPVYRTPAGSGIGLAFMEWR